MLGHRSYGGSREQNTIHYCPFCEKQKCVFCLAQTPHTYTLRGTWSATEQRPWMESRTRGGRELCSSTKTCVGWLADKALDYKDPFLQGCCLFTLFPNPLVNTFYSQGEGQAVDFLYATRGLSQTTLSLNLSIRSSPRPQCSPSHMQDPSLNVQQHNELHLRCNACAFYRR